jgi:alpha-N-arabinofuranosidase
MSALCGLGLLLVTASAITSPPLAGDHLLRATLAVDDRALPKPILSPGQLFGSFFEDFLHAGEGGAYAEKLSNRALALPLANTSFFRCSGAVGTGECTWFVERGTVTRDGSVPLNTAVPNTMWLEPSAVAANAGFPGGIAVNAGDALRLSLFVYVPGSGRASIEARLVDGMEPAGRVLGSTIVTAQGSQWARVEASLDVNVSSGSNGCRFQLINSENSGSRVGVTVVSLFPTRTWMGRKNGLRVDVAEWLNESRPAFLRTPGGCYVEGHNLSASGWDWKKTLGPIETRPGHMNDAWGYWTDVRQLHQELFAVYSDSC